MATVCLVEDYADNRVLVTALLRAAAFEVVPAEDAPAFDKLVADGLKADLFLLDLSLPGEGGASLMQRIKADPRWKGVPVVALTAHAMQGDEEKALAQGFDGYITKPIDIGTFADTVRGYLASRRGA